jgi:hypothetical protein
MAFSVPRAGIRTALPRARRHGGRTARQRVLDRGGRGERGAPETRAAAAHSCTCPYNLFKVLILDLFFFLFLMLCFESESCYKNFW